MTWFTREDFDVMVYEVLDKNPASFDKLGEIMHNTLPKFVQSICGNYGNLLRNDWEDILEDSYVRIMLNCVTHFLLKNGPDAPRNLDPDGFACWMRTVAANIASDYAKRNNKRKNRTKQLDDINEPEDEDAREKIENIDRSRRLLNIAVSVVLDAEKQAVYKVLTWLAQAVFYLDYDCDKRSDATKVVLDKFSQKTIFEMRDIVFAAIDKISWLRISDQQKKNIDSELAKKVNDKKAAGEAEPKMIGELLYKEVFMAKGGNSTVSDWVNRLDKLVRQLTALSVDEDGTLNY